MSEENETREGKVGEPESRSRGGEACFRQWTQLGQRLLKEVRTENLAGQPQPIR